MCKVLHVEFLVTVELNTVRNCSERVTELPEDVFVTMLCYSQVNEAVCCCITR